MSTIYVLTRRLLNVLLELKELPRHFSGVCQAEMAAHTAERLESVWLFSSDRVCLKSLHPLCLIEYMPRKPSATLFNRICPEILKPTILQLCKLW